MKNFEVLFVWHEVRSKFWITLSPLLKISWLYVWVYFWILYFVPFIYVYSFINIILSSSWKCYSVSSPALLLLSKIALASILDPSHSHMNFRIPSHFIQKNKTKQKNLLTLWEYMDSIYKLIWGLSIFFYWTAQSMNIEYPLFLSGLL